MAHPPASLPPDDDAPRVRRVALNPHPEGRDFIVGDIHGAFDAVIAAMKRAQFMPSRDRLFSVGDLVDRGSGSARAKRFLAQPYVHAIAGNHEANLVALFEQGEPAQPVLEWYADQFRADWLLKLSSDERLELIALFKALPIVIELQTRRGTVGLVHGDVPAGMDWSTFTAAVERGDEAVIACALEGRQRLKAKDWSGVDGIGRLFVGHTPQVGGPSRYANVYAVDTGAVFRELDRDDERFGLTLMDVCFKTESLGEKMEAVEALMVLADDSGLGPGAGEGTSQAPFSSPSALRERYSSPKA